MESRVLERVFEFNGLRLPEVSPKLSPEEIRTLYSQQYPDIAAATITGPEAVGDKLVYRFTRAVGTKGYLYQSLVARGHPGGLHVTVLDGDAISVTNCVRQPFARSEVGLNKAIVLVNRINLFWGSNWDAVPAHLRTGTFISRGYSCDDLRAHIVVGCVDTRAARAAIRDAVGKWSTVSYSLDLGNSADSGQFVLGEPMNERNRRSRLRLRTAAELFPEIVDPTLDDDGQPSCNATAALERQEPFINSTLAQHALALLARLFRYGTLCYHGGFINLSTGIGSRLQIDASLWRRLRRRCKR